MIQAFGTEKFAKMVSVRRTVVLALCLAFVMAATGRAGAEERRYTLDAQDRPIQEFLREVAKITGKNILVDPGVTGTVTLVSPAPLTAAEVWNVTLSALAVNGFTAVESGAIVKIVPRSKAASEAISTFAAKAPGGGEEFVTDLIELRYAKADAVASSASTLLSPDEKAAPAPGRNAIIVIATAANAARVRELVTRMDTEGAATAIDVIRLDYVNAAQLAQVLQELFGKAGGVSGRGCECVFTAEPRSNSLIVRAPAGEQLAARRLAEKLDRTEGAVEVAKLKNLSSDEARDMLQTLVLSR
ncbi:MAG: hypothetical protein IT350_10420 [Deltaproteobacteria bacterium]|nr:hypothetical protein [Deltaproteobacteria bacterium]